MYLSWSRYFILIFICSVLLIGSTAIAYMHMGAHAAIATLTTASYACVIYLLIALAICLGSDTAVATDWPQRAC